MYSREMVGEVLLPPSPNWFFINAQDSRAEDQLLVTATYRSILVQQLNPGKKLPTLLKVIPNQNEKLQFVRLCPRASEPEYGHTVASVCEGSIVRLFNMHTGDAIAEHRHHEGLSVNGICWGSVDKEEVVVTVGGGGRVVVWQPQHSAYQTHTLPQTPELTVVEVNPKDRGQALVAATKEIALVNLKNGWVLTWLKGHDMNIYCLRWYEGEENPFAEEYPTNSRAEAMMEDRSGEERNKTHGWQQNSRGDSNGPFFASSDHGRNIYLWDISAKRYVTKMNVPIMASGYKRPPPVKDKTKLKQHIPLAWYKKGLLSSTVHGELLLWTSQMGKWKYKPLHHLHNRAIYNLLLFGDVVVTSGQDRMLYGYDVAHQAHLFQLSTLGAFATSLTFCPQDASRLAVGSMDNTIRLLKFGSPTPLQTLTVSHNIKGKILSLCWHPEQEGHLLFGTAAGQVAWLNISNSHLNTFAYYHQKASYKVEWAPPVCPHKSGISETWCAYSYGDREIVMRSVSSPLANPLSLKNLVPDPDNKKFPKDVTEFAFSPDYSFLAVGLNDGQVLIYRRQDLEQLATVVVVKKAVQHLLWKPKADSGPSYTLAVASNENDIQLFCLDNFLKGLQDKSPDDHSLEVLVTQATRVLSGHEARVVWLSWSPHKPSVLASASYDHTIQLWETDNGSMLGNYGGHSARVFRVEFSPSDPDLLFSAAEENALHCWRPSKLTCKTPAESNAVLKEYRAKKEPGVAAGEETTAAPQDTSESKQESAVSVQIEANTTATVTITTTTTKATSVSDSTKKSSSDSGKKAAVKSFFPKLHKVCSRKKTFHHLLLLSLLAVEEAKQERDSSQQKGAAGKDSETLEDDLEDLEGDEAQEKELAKEVDARPIVVDTTEKYSFLLEKDSEMAPPEDFLYVMQMHGQPQQVDALLAAEIETHESKGNASHASLMHCWRGSLGTHIHLAAKQKKLTPFLVASAPQVSMKLWEVACEAYAEQLLAEGDAVTAASYLLNIHKVEEAIDMLLQHRHFREALAIVKTRLGFSQDQLEKVVGRWVNSAIYDGNMDLAALLQLSTGQLEAAARTLSRRTDSGSLFVSAQVYAATGNAELAISTGLMALREASVRQEMDKVEAFLCHLSGVKWFRVVSTLHCLLLKVIQQEDTVCFSYLFHPSESGGEAAAAGGRGSTCLVEEVKRQWEAQGFSQSQYQSLYQHLETHFSTQQSPSSVKHLWFLVSLSLCECLLAPSYQLWDQHLTAALRHAVTWGKADQLLHLTHALLPRGRDDMALLRSTAPEPQEGEMVPPPSLHVLWQCYQQAEVALLHTYIMGDTCWSDLQKDKYVIDRDTEAVNQEEAQISQAAVHPSDASSASAVGEGVLQPGSECRPTHVTPEGNVPVLCQETKAVISGRDEEASFCFPRSVGSLKTSLSFYLENIDRDPEVFSEMIGVTSSALSTPIVLLQEIVTLLHRKDIFDSADKESFLFGLGAQ